MATATNVYLMLYPKPALAKVLLNKPELLKKVWQALDRMDDEALMGEGRVYGGGLHKLEPRELGTALAVNILEFLPKRSVPELSVRTERNCDVKLCPQKISFMRLAIAI